MARDRARSSFTVEVRRGRQSGGDADPKRSLWRGLDLAGEAARHEAIAVPGRAPAPLRHDPFAPKAQVPRREASQARVLPSLLAPPALVEEPAAEMEAPEILPRVRRPRRSRPARPVETAPDEAIVVQTMIGEVAADEDDETADEVSGTDEVSQPRLRRRAPRGGDRVLRAGERWKRRLPRSLW